MKAQRFRHHVEAIANAIEDARAEGEPTEVLAVLDKALQGIKWRARPDTGETKADAVGNGGTLVLVVRLEVRR
jgi:hypothetical protein